MKFSFWLELPVALIDLLGLEASKNEVELAKTLIISFKGIEKLNTICQNEYDKVKNSLATDTLSTQLVIEKITKINYQKSDLICKSIKLSTQLAQRLLEGIESELRREVLGEYNCYLRLKMFLKLTRSMIENINEDIKESTNEEETNFLKLIKLFTEKVQCKLFNVSHKLMKRTLNRKTIETLHKRRSSSITPGTNKKEQNF